LFNSKGNGRKLGFNTPLSLILPKMRYAFEKIGNIQALGPQTLFLHPPSKLLQLIANKDLQKKIFTRGRPISFSLIRYRYFQTFSPIFGRLPIFRWSPISIFQNLLTDIFAIFW